MLTVLQTLLFTKLLPILGVAIGFGLLITVHEFGHYLFAKLFGIGTPAFSIGFGPVLIQRRMWNTDFRFSLIPLGGYCAIQGQALEGIESQGAQSEENSASFDDKPYWQKLLVMLGGIIFNIVFAYIAFTAIHIGPRPKLHTTLQITQVVNESAAAHAGIHANDTITGYDNIQFSSSASDVQKQLRAFLATIAKRPNQLITLHITDQHGTTCSKPVLLHQKGKTGSLGVGIDLSAHPIPGQFEHDSFGSAVCKGIAMTHQWIAQTASGIANIFKRRSLNGVGGPVAMFTQTFKMAKNGFRSLLTFLGILSVLLAVTNLIPLGALDGGQLLFETIEFVIRRRLPEKVKETIILASIALFIGLVLFLSYHDILRLIGW